MSKLSVEYGGMVSKAAGIPYHLLKDNPGVYERADAEDNEMTVIVDDIGHVFTVRKNGTSIDAVVGIFEGPPGYGTYKPAGFAVTFRMLAPS